LAARDAIAGRLIDNDRLALPVVLYLEMRSGNELPCSIWNMDWDLVAQVKAIKAEVEAMESDDVIAEEIRRRENQ
jgi:hypothetical protein